ncbi:MAG: hypothetical protein R2839_00575 [Thermomicrobiales bacterium]
MSSPFFYAYRGGRGGVALRVNGAGEEQGLSRAAMRDCNDRGFPGMWWT